MMDFGVFPGSLRERLRCFFVSLETCTVDIYQVDTDEITHDKISQ